jgi:hypothetical protein
MKNPINAPATVPNSRTVATLIFVSLSFKKVAAPLEEVAMMEIKLAATAYLISTLKMRVKAGTTMIPPPSPRRAPRIPAAMEMRKRMRLNIIQL